ncbi:MAG: alkaline phosphatase family protein [Myxococcota bacterium]|nr:alkaline phosphatase family protein [Myxococcota bacterium]
MNSFCIVLSLLATGVLPSAEVAPQRVLVIGMDGATFEIMDHLVAEGKLPNIAKFYERGARLILESEVPMRSPALWTTIATGQARSVHGIYDFVTGSGYWPKHLRTEARKLVSSEMRRSPALWNLADEAGLESLVVGWLNTWPAEKLRGAMVAPYVALGDKKQSSIKGKIYREVEGQSSPSELFKKLRSHIVEPDDISTAELARIFSDPESISSLFKIYPSLERAIYTVRWSMASAITNVNIINRLLRSYKKTRLLMTYFDGTDTLAHRFWLFREPIDKIRARLKAHHLPQHKATVLKQQFGRVLDNFYGFLDQQIGRIIKAAGKNTTVYIVSDHGWKSDPNTTATHAEVPFDGVHDLEGVCLAMGPSIRPNRLRISKRASLYDIAPTVLYTLGLPVPSYMGGDILTRLFRPAFKFAYPPKITARLHTFNRKRKPNEKDEKGGSAHFSDEELERLRSLGYVQ